jgi:hypothetical protein
MCGEVTPLWQWEKDGNSKYVTYMYIDSVLKWEEQFYIVYSDREETEHFSSFLRRVSKIVKSDY